MILEDILVETAQDMNRIESMTWTVYAGQETKVLAEDMLVMINSFQNEVHMVSKKWETNKYLKEKTELKISTRTFDRENYVNPFAEALENEGRNKDEPIPS